MAEFLSQEEIDALLDIGPAIGEYMFYYDFVKEDYFIEELNETFLRKYSLKNITETKIKDLLRNENKELIEIDTKKNLIKQFAESISSYDKLKKKNDFFKKIVDENIELLV